MPAEHIRRSKRQAEREAATQAGKRQKLEPQEETTATRGQDTTHAQPSKAQTRHDNPLTSTAFLEGQISPKNLGDGIGHTTGTLTRPRSPSPSTSPAAELLAPPPAKRRRTSPTPPVSNLTRASIEALLPGSAFGHAAPIFKKRHWTIKDEHALRKDWSASDEAELVARGTSDAEVIAWRATASVFGCAPPDLFRYGLRQQRRRGDEEDDNRTFWQAMLRLLVHPFWAGSDVAAPRRALQVAVMHRIGPHGHAQPLAPPWSREEPGFVAWVRELHARRPAAAAGSRESAERRVELAGIAEFRSTAQVNSRWGMRELEAIMGRLAQEASRGYYRPVPAFERFLFMVQVEDVVLVERSLGRMYQGNGDPSEVTTMDYFREYWRKLPDEARKVTEADRQWVLQQKRLAIIGERREALIRHRLREAGGHLHLLDIPPFDPDPDFHLYSEVSEAQLLVIRGQRPPPPAYRWARTLLGRRADSMTLHAYGIMARALGAPTGAAGTLFGDWEDAAAKPVADAPVDGSRNLAGLLFSSHILRIQGGPLGLR